MGFYTSCGGYARATERELDAAHDAGSEDGEFTPERWREGEAQNAYLQAWNRANPDDQRTLAYDDPPDHAWSESSR